MKSKALVILLALAVPAKLYAQTQIDRSIAVEKGQVIDMHFDYPELIRVSTWNGSDISITGTVSINGGENDNAFVLEDSKHGNVVNVKAFIRNIKSLPQRITVWDGEKKVIFRDKAALKQYQATHGRSFSSTSWGPDIEIRIEVKVPENVKTNITSVYGMVEVSDFKGPLAVEATYGGVDATLEEKALGEVTAVTDFGEIYTNLDVKFSDQQGRSGDFHTFVSAKAGNGPPVSFESKYGNVYLRKAEQN